MFIIITITIIIFIIIIIKHISFTYTRMYYNLLPFNGFYRGRRVGCTCVDKRLRTQQTSLKELGAHFCFPSPCQKQVQATQHIEPHAKDNSPKKIYVGFEASPVSILPSYIFPPTPGKKNFF